MTKRYVDNSRGNDANPGTFDKPVATVQAGVDLLVDGDELWINDGTYTASAVFDGLSNIKIRGYGNKSPVVYGGSRLLGLAWKSYADNVWVREAMPGDPIALLMYDAVGNITKGWRMDAVGEVNAPRKFFYDTIANKLYLWSKEDPTYAFARIDYTARDGETAVYAGTAGLHFKDCADFDIDYLRVYGWHGNGVIVDDCFDFVSGNDFLCSYNSEDGCGGFGQAGWIFNGGIFSWNGTRRARNQGEIWTDGDGISFHDTLVGAVPSVDIYMIRCVFEGDDKDASQNIHYSDNIVMDGCLIINCNFNLILNCAGGHQILRNNEIRASVNDIGAIGISTGGTLDVFNNTIIGPGSSASSAVAITMLAGTVDFKNNVVTGWQYEYVYDGGTFTSTHNTLYGNGTALFQMPLGSNDNRVDPKIAQTAKGTYEIGVGSSAAFTGADLTAEGFTTDARGRTRKTGAWSRGAYEPTRGPRAIIIADNAEFLELVYGL